MAKERDITKNPLESKIKKTLLEKSQSKLNPLFN